MLEVSEVLAKFKGMTVWHEARKANDSTDKMADFMLVKLRSRWAANCRGVGVFDEFDGLEVVGDGAFEFAVGEEGIDEVALGVEDAVAGEVFFAGGVVV